MATPPSTWSIAGQMIKGAATSLAAKIVYGVLAGLVLIGALINLVANGVGGFFAVIGLAIVALIPLAFFLAIPTFVVVLFIAQSRARRAEESLMAQYAGQRRLVYSPSGRLPESTPLLSAGTSRQTQDLMAGLLPGGLQGTLAHYTYYVRHSSGQGQSTTTPYPHTVVLVQVPESTAFVRRLLCQERRLGGGSFFGINLSGDDEVVLESAAINERYRIKTGSGQDQAWLRELFTPVFIDWLATKAMAEFSFELVDGLLVVSVGERLDRADKLDWLCGAATYVAGRLRGEVAEEMGPQPA